MLVRLGHLEVVAEHLVEADLERADAGALPLALLERQQMLLAVARQRAQPVQLGVDSGADDAAVLDRARWVVLETGGQLGFEIGERIGGGDLPQQPRRAVRDAGLDLRRHGQGLAQGGRLARAQPAEHGAAAEPLRIAHRAQQLAQPGPALGPLQQLRHRLEPQLDGRRLAQRLPQPAPQQAAAPGRHRAVEDAEQRPVAAGAARRLEDLQVRQRRGVEDEGRGAVADRQAAHVPQPALLGALGVVERRGGGPHRGLAGLEPEAAHGRDAQMALQQVTRLALIQPLSVLQPADAQAVALRPLPDPGRQPLPRLHQQQLTGRVEAQIVEGLAVVGPAADEERAGRDVEKRGGGPAVVAGQRREEVLLRPGQQLGVAQGAGGDDPGHLPAHQTLGLGGLLHLVADRHLEAGAHRLGEVDFEGVVRHPAHRRFALGAALPRGERHLQQRRGALGVLEEQLVEVAHPVEQQGVRMLRLELQIVAQHRRQLRCLGHPRQYSPAPGGARRSPGALAGRR